MPQGWRPEGLPPNPPRPRGDAARRHPLRHAGAARLECLRVGAFRRALAAGVGLMAEGKSLAPRRAGRGRRACAVGPAEYRRHLRPSPLGASLRAHSIARFGSHSGGRPSGPRVARCRRERSWRWRLLRCGCFCSIDRREFGGSPQRHSRSVASSINSDTAECSTNGRSRRDFLAGQRRALENAGRTQGFHLSFGNTHRHVVVRHQRHIAGPARRSRSTTVIREQVEFRPVTHSNNGRENRCLVDVSSKARTASGAFRRT